MKKKLEFDKLFFFIRKPRFALVISICIVIVGVISLLGLKQESYPDVTPFNLFSKIVATEDSTTSALAPI